MASRTPPRGRSSSSSSSRSAKSSSSSSQPLIFGGVGLVVVIALVVMMNRKAADPDGSPAGAHTPAAAAPAAAPAPLAAAKTGKNPTRPAPSLTPAMLEQVRSSHKVAEGLYNEGVTARLAGDNATARDKQAKAKDALENLAALLEQPLRWQEEAQLEGWSQPAEYVTLEKDYGAVMKLTNRIRKGGGK